MPPLREDVGSRWRTQCPRDGDRSFDEVASRVPVHLYSILHKAASFRRGEKPRREASYVLRSISTLSPRSISGVLIVTVSKAARRLDDVNARTKRFVAVVVLVFLVATAVAWLFLRRIEPVYNGKPLTFDGAAIEVISVGYLKMPTAGGEPKGPRGGVDQVILAPAGGNSA